MPASDQVTGVHLHQYKLAVGRAAAQELSYDSGTFNCSRKERKENQSGVCPHGANLPTENGKELKVIQTAICRTLKQLCHEVRDHNEGTINNLTQKIYEKTNCVKFCFQVSLLDASNAGKLVFFSAG